jgi:hypothetical protein
VISSGEFISLTLVTLAEVARFYAFPGEGLLSIVCCQGDACDVVAVSWDSAAHCYRLTNGSDHWVLMTLTTWPAAVEIRLAPRQTCLVAVAEFDLPYRADFISGTAR